jgi:hypothetical protein
LFDQLHIILHMRWFGNANKEDEKSIDKYQDYKMFEHLSVGVCNH